MLWHPLFGAFKVPRRPIRAIEIGLRLVIHPTLVEMASTDQEAEEVLVKTLGLGLGREYRFRR